MEGGEGTKESGRVEGAGGGGGRGRMLEVVAKKPEEFLESLKRRRIRSGGG